MLAFFFNNQLINFSQPNQVSHPHSLPPSSLPSPSPSFPFPAHPLPLPSLQERAGPPCISVSHDISSCSKAAQFSY